MTRRPVRPGPEVTHVLASILTHTSRAAPSVPNPTLGRESHRPTCRRETCVVHPTLDFAPASTGKHPTSPSPLSGKVRLRRRSRPRDSTLSCAQRSSVRRTGPDWVATGSTTVVVPPTEETQHLDYRTLPCHGGDGLDKRGTRNMWTPLRAKSSPILFCGRDP